MIRLRRGFDYRPRVVDESGHALGEVEACLARHPAVAECAVVGVPDASGLTKPHAWVIARGPGEDLARELMDFVAGQLQPYKAPRAVHIVAELPRTHLGKVDRGALRRTR